MQEDDEEFISLTLKTRNSKKPLRMHERTWKKQWLPLCLARHARRARMGKPVAGLMISNQNLRVSWKPVNPHDCVWKNIYRITMRTILQEKVTIHYNITIWYTNLFLCLKAMKIPAAKAALNKELMDICHLKNAELETKHQKYKGRVVLRGDIVKDDSGSYAVFTEQGSSASQMTAAKVMDIISRLPGCSGQAADAVSADTQVKMEDAPKLLKIRKSECPDIWIRLPRHKWPKSWSSMEDPVVPLERHLYGHPLAGLLWERQFEKILLKHGWEKFHIGNVSLYIVKRDCSCLCVWMT